MTSPQRLTDEEKKLFEPMLHDTWNAIGSDAIDAMEGKRLKVSDIVEITCDANRPMEYGGMTREQYKRLSDCYHHNDTQRWLRKILNY